MSAPDNVEGMGAELQRMAGEVAAVDAQAAQGGAADQAAVMPGQPDATEQQVAEVTSLIMIASGLFVPVFPKLAEVYTPQTCASLAGAVVPVMQKHGWSAGEFMGKWAAELALLAVAVPVGYSTYAVIVEQLAEGKAEAKEAEKKPIQAEVNEPGQGADNLPLVAERG